MLFLLLVTGSLTIPLPWEPVVRTAFGPDSLVLRARVFLPNTALRWVLHLPAARFAPTLRVNGQEIALPGDDFLPRKVEITSRVHPGDNTLELVLHSWTVRLLDPPRWLAEARDWIRVRQRLRDQALAPIGGRFHRYGLWGRAFLAGYPGAFIQDVDVVPHVPDSLEVRVELSESARVVGRILDGSRILWTFADTGRTVRAAWPRPDLALWWPDTPRLYTLEIAAPGETVRVAVGWRKFEARGGRFLLNGRPVILCGTSFWPTYVPEDPGYIRKVLKRIREMHARIFRTHTRPWDTLWYALADSMGVLMIPEGALFNDDRLYRLDDPRFDAAVRAHHRAMIRALSHHPSVVMWSLGNELWGKRSQQTRYEQLFGDWLAHARVLDPSRPVYLEGDGDPDGESDVIGIHYPLAYHRHLLWPMEAFFLDRPIPVRHWFWPERAFLWQRRKPLYIGEFLWVPSPTPHLYTTVVGDEAFLPDGWARAKARLWQWQIVAYRHFRVSGFAPWSVQDAGLSILDDTPLFRAQQDACKPVRAAFRRFRRSAPAGHYEDTLEIFHDVYEREMLRLQVGTSRTTVLDTLLDLPPFSHRDIPLRVDFPVREAFRRETLRVSLMHAGVAVDRRSLPVDVLSPPVSVPSAVWPPDRRWVAKQEGRVLVRMERASPWGTWIDAPASLIHVWSPHPLTRMFPEDFYSLWGQEGISARGMVDPPPSPYVLPLLGVGRPRGMKAVALLEAREQGAVLWYTLDDTTPEGKVWVAVMQAALDTLSLPGGLTVWPGLGDLAGMFAIPYAGSTAVWLRPHPGRPDQIRVLSRYVREGGRVFVERPSQAEARLLGLNLEEADTPVERTDHPLARWLLREHLFVYDVSSPSWKRAAKRPVADGVFTGGIPLTDPPAVVVVPWGRGFWVVSRLKDPRDIPELQKAYLDLLRMLLWAGGP